jgi:hypothetical protein
MHQNAADTHNMLRQHLNDRLNEVDADAAIKPLVTERLPLLEAFFSGQNDDGANSRTRNVYDQTVHFVREYIGLAPDYLFALATLAEMDNIDQYTTPFLQNAIHFFFNDEYSKNTQATVEGKVETTLETLLSQAYSFHRMIEELNDRVALERQVPLAPMDLAYTNLIAHTIIGDKEANLLDQHVLIKLELTSAQLASEAELIFQNPATKSLTEQRRDQGWQDVYEKWPFFDKDITHPEK